MKISKQTKQLPLCSQCGKKLIFVRKIETKDTFSKMIITTYKCSDKLCQTGIDKRTKARIKLQKEQDSAKIERVKTKMRLNKSKILR
ncbi:MAG: hypothetical protein A3C22_00790 [Candidatus Levybacteria bacterium RIFCSPHIGHO2_02_FULL_37_10]|nr:MAG: hypothetical protein A3C22_00790 [Candidatus Levybacteria bacterium RIFCSPHIGHO2_02_FULL_37_10]OGH42012.1 MAG: hypothetical protein A3H79_00305 [Candidatus Levybacteria bacterium RIFCSPLOWO2_02_FULL_36_8b]